MQRQRTDMGQEMPNCYENNLLFMGKQSLMFPCELVHIRKQRTILSLISVALGTLLLRINQFHLTLSGVENLKFSYIIFTILIIHIYFG